MTQTTAALEHLSLGENETSRDSMSSEADSSSDDDDSLLHHMEKKYLEDQEVDSFIDIFGTSPCKLATEKHLKMLVLNRMSIATIGDEQKLASLIASVTDVDLAFNKIRDWQVIATLFCSMPSLRRLNLSHNPLNSTLDVDLPESTKLITLALNGINLPPETLSHIFTKTPSVQELHLSENEAYASGMQSFDQVISDKVSHLHLNACEFESWDDVLFAIRAFPGVSRLYLSDNRLSSITLDSERQRELTKSATYNLRFLSLAGCFIDNWQSIECLGHIENLNELRIISNPLFNGYSEEERFHLVIGRLPSLKVLNGSPITEAQREESERWFVRYYQNLDDKPPIFSQLVEIHGNLDPLVKVDFTPRMYAVVSLICEERNLRTQLRVRLNRTVMDLLRYASKYTGIPVSRIRLFYQDVIEGGCGPNELRFPNQVLHTLHIEDDGAFLVQSKIMPPGKSILR